MSGTPGPSTRSGNAENSGISQGCGIGRQPLAVHLLAEVVELLCGEPPEEEGTRVDPRCRMPLHEQQIAFARIGARSPEVVVADVVQGRRRGEARDMTAHVRVPVRAQHHGECVPPDVGANAVLELVVAGRTLFAMWRDGVDVGGIGAVGQIGARSSRLLDQPLEEVVRPLRALATPAPTRARRAIPAFPADRGRASPLLSPSCGSRRVGSNRRP